MLPHGPTQAAPFRAPALPADGGVRPDETCEYRISVRKKSQFHSVVDPVALFGAEPGTSHATTRVRDIGGAPTCQIEVVHHLGEWRTEETLDCTVDDGLHAARLRRQIVNDEGVVSRSEDVNFQDGPIEFPPATYPEVLLPFVMRWQPHDGEIRAAYSWTNDRFVARVYCETRRTREIEVPAGRFEVHEVWMYPDLNDWVRLGGLLTRLAKPLLPRYNMWFETTEPFRLVQFEGAYGPPGAPEIVLKLAARTFNPTAEDVL